MSAADPRAPSDVEATVARALREWEDFTANLKSLPMIGAQDWVGLNRGNALAALLRSAPRSLPSEDDMELVIGTALLATGQQTFDAPVAAEVSARAVLARLRGAREEEK